VALILWRSVAREAPPPWPVSRPSLQLFQPRLYSTRRRSLCAASFSLLHFRKHFEAATPRLAPGPAFARFRFFLFQLNRGVPPTLFPGPFACDGGPSVFPFSFPRTFFARTNGLLGPLHTRHRTFFRHTQTQNHPTQPQTTSPSSPPHRFTTHHPT